jgi:N-acetylglucosaminyl-diphospho-decaprenol L-rhamnosyltransferase
MDLSIIIVNWNSKDYVKKCLASVFASIRDLRFEVIVIDSASFDGCAEMIRENFSDVRFMQSEKNVGFAKANNLAFTASNGEVILFLNPDTEILGDAIGETYNALRTLPQPGVLGCKLLNSDGSIQTTCVRAFPTIVNQVLESDLLRRIFPNSGLWGTAPLSKNDPCPASVQAVSGAFMMLSRALFKKVGMFTTSYFMYSEDMDLCLKVTNAGVRNYFVPSSVVIHHGGGATNNHSVNTFSTVMMVESRWRYFRQTRSVFYALCYRVLLCVNSLGRVAIAATLLFASLLSGKSARYIPLVRKWFARLKWSVGLESWASKV